MEVGAMQCLIPDPKYYLILTPRITKSLLKLNPKIPEKIPETENLTPKPMVK